MKLGNLLGYEPLADAYFYAFTFGALHALLVCMAALALLPRLVRSGWERYLRTLRRFALFNALLLVFGMLGNSAWMTFVYRHLYTNPDNVFDFVPFFPFGSWAIGYSGSLLGGTGMGQLQALWTLLAAVVWALTFLAYRGITKGTLLIQLRRIVRFEELMDPQ
jgi:hypothetical protein